MSHILSGKSGAFPQTGVNRTQAEIVKDVLDAAAGGDSNPTMQERAARAINAAIREFNTTAWTFNRFSDDIILDPTYGMTKNTTAGSVSRDAGIGNGFMLSSGNIIKYWIEERVKSGGQILKRNYEDGSKVITLTGDGTTDKPVITRPAALNSDATHWALYGTATNGVWPDGAEIGEVAIATTTIEDDRVGTNPTLPEGEIYQPGEYDLTGDFRTPIRCALLDPEGRERRSITFRPWTLHSLGLTKQTTSTVPDVYTVRNGFRTGKVSFWPRPGVGMTYPVARLEYVARIVQLFAATDKMIVPEEVEEAISRRAAAIMALRFRTPQDAAILNAEAGALRSAVEFTYADYEDWA